MPSSNAIIHPELSGFADRHKEPRQYFTVVFAQTVFHSALVRAENTDAAEAKAADVYEWDSRLFPAHILPKPWQRWWGDYQIDDVTVTVPAARMKGGAL